MKTPISIPYRILITFFLIQYLACISISANEKPLTEDEFIRTIYVNINKEQKPVWLIIQAFEADHPPSADFPFRYPTPTQLRAMVYAGIIHAKTSSEKGFHSFYSKSR